MSQAVGASQSESLRDRRVRPVPAFERGVPQYSPEWVKHVTEGGDLRDGNILVTDQTRTKRKRKS